MSRSRHIKWSVVLSPEYEVFLILKLDEKCLPIKIKVPVFSFEMEQFILKHLNVNGCLIVLFLSLVFYIITLESNTCLTSSAHLKSRK